MNSNKVRNFKRAIPFTCAFLLGIVSAGNTFDVLYGSEHASEELMRPSAAQDLFDQFEYISEDTKKV
jgi:hypothetical protein